MKLLFNSTAAVAAVLFIAPLLLGFAFGLDAVRDAWRVIGLAVAVTGVVWHDNLQRDSQRQMLAGALLAVVAGSTLSIVYAAVWNHLHMGEYDFFALYMDARVAWERMDFYEPASYQQIYAAMVPPPFAEMHPGFERNVLGVGTKYPPPTLLYLMPFGGLERLSAHIVWVVCCWVAILACILMFWRGVLGSKSMLSLLAVAALVLVFPGTKLNVSLEQMHFTALALLLGCFLLRHHAIAGLFVALGTLIKPPVAALAMYLLYARRWPGFMVLLASTVVLCGLSIAVFGWDVFARFFTDNPNLRVSDSLFYEDMNRSLQGTVVRTFGWDFANGTPMQHPIFLIGAGVICVLTAIGTWLTRNRRDPRLVILLLCFALLLYPGTQRHYSVLLMAPLMLQMLLAERDGWPRPTIALLGFGVGVFSVSHTLWAVLALWTAALIMIAMNRDDASASNEISEGT